jgi:hypothetical protein
MKSRSLSANSKQRSTSQQKKLTPVKLHEKSPFLKAIYASDVKLVTYLLQQGHHKIKTSSDLPKPHTLATLKNSCTIVNLLF